MRILTSKQERELFRRMTRNLNALKAIYWAMGVVAGAAACYLIMEYGRSYDAGEA